MVGVESFSLINGVTVPGVAGEHFPTSKTTAQWADGLGHVFEHVALFDVRGTVARVSSVHGVSPAAVGRNLSLNSQTPLRWAIEAASALVSSGNSPGGGIIARGLGLSRPRAFAVLPLIIDGDLQAIAYVDNGESTLTMSAVSKVFGVVDASLRDDVHYVTRLETTSFAVDQDSGVAQCDPLDVLESEAPESWCPAPSPPRGPSYDAEPDDIDEIEAMLDKALANNPLVDEAVEPDTGASPVVSLQDHLHTTAEGAVQGQAVVPQAPMAAPALPAEEPPLPAPSGKSPAQKRSEREQKLKRILSEPAQEATLLKEAPPVVSFGREPAQPQPTPSEASAAEAPPAPRLSPESGGDWSLEDLIRLGKGTRVVGGRGRFSNLSRQLLAAAMFIAALTAGMTAAVAPPSEGPQAGFAFRVHPNSSLEEIANHLKRQGVIRSSLGFRVLARTQGVERDLRAGQYSIPRGAWVWDVLSELHRGQVRTRSVTIPEGLTLQETAEIVEASGLVTTEKFLKAARDPDLISTYGLQTPTAEGFLFPETYTFAEELSAPEIVREMVDLFFARVTQLAGTREVGPSELVDIVTLASIVEREAKSRDEMSRIAGVFKNRMARNMRLESCATVQYILGKPKERLLLSDLRKESPYNTYLKPGLPPGPISNPGLAALGAAFTPEVHQYLFFLAKNDGSNEHTFTRTYAQHQKARLLQKQQGQ